MGKSLSSAPTTAGPSRKKRVTWVWFRTVAPYAAALRAFSVQRRNGSIPYSSIVTAPSVPGTIPGSSSCSSASVSRVCAFPFLRGWYRSYASK